VWEQEEIRSTNVVDNDTARRNSGKNEREEERDLRIKKGNKQDRKFNAVHPQAVYFSTVNSWDPSCTKSNLNLFYGRGLMMAPRS